MNTSKLRKVRYKRWISFLSRFPGRALKGDMQKVIFKKYCCLGQSCRLLPPSEGKKEDMEWFAPSRTFGLIGLRNSTGGSVLSSDQENSLSGINDNQNWRVVTRTLQRKSKAYLR